MSNLIIMHRLRQIALKPAFIHHHRLVSTSKKNNETVVTVGDAVGTTKQPPAAVTKKEHKNWIYYGYDINSKEGDRHGMHSAMFGTITICLVFGGLFLAYVPDYNLRDWSIREGFLELRRRELNGLPLVDPNLVDPAKIRLPSDEELGDTEIII